MKNRKSKRKAPAPEKLPDELLDDVDKFHKQADSDSLEQAPDADDDSDDVEGVMDLDDDSEPDSDADLEAGGDLATSAGPRLACRPFAVHTHMHAAHQTALLHAWWLV